MKIDVISMNCIKPSSPTPSHLKTLKLTNHHHQSPDVHFNFTFFYSLDSATNFSVQSKVIQNSLASTLISFYPFAGRFHNDNTIICNDDGVFFIEAKTETNLPEFLAHPDLLVVIRDHLVPDATDPNYNGSMLLIKFTLFACGSTSISISISHKIADLATFITLLHCWSSLSRGCGSGGPAGGSIRPANFNLIGQIVPNVDPTNEVLIPQASATRNFLLPGSNNRKFISKRLIFSASKIKQLKAEVTNELSKLEKEDDGISVSRVDVVIALIWKCALATTSFRQTLLMHAANIRTRTNPPLPESCTGNLVILFPMMAEKESDMELHEFVNKLLAFKMWANNLKKKFQVYDPQQVVEAIIGESMKEMESLCKNSKDFSHYISSSFCNFPLNEIDFGWGKPAWVTNTPRILMANTIYLLDAKEVGGVEALVHFREEEMKAFLLNQELLQFATVNPIPPINS